jgi:DUF971 family protein
MEGDGMKQPPVLIKKVYQKDNITFCIEWSDGLVTDYRLGALQKRCPCAQCYDPAAGVQLCKSENLDNNVRAIRIVNVGRYALRVDFQSGCSKGIYSFAMLRELIKEGANV